MFEVVKRTGQAAILSKKKPTWNRYLYEVVIIESVPEVSLFGSDPTPAHERMPSPAKWGTVAWSYPTLEAAVKRFDSLVAGFCRSVVS